MSARKYKFQAAFLAGGSVNYANRRLEGVSVITQGPALGHGVMIDAESLATVKTCAEEYRGGLKVKMNHYSGADAIIGRLNNFRIDGEQLRADLDLLRNHAMTALVLEMAETMPDSFGLSISFSGTIDENEDEEKVMRCLEIYSCDIVDQPAANPTGLFSIPFDTTTKAMATFETPEYLALQAEHKNITHEVTTLRADLESLTLANKGLLERATLAEANAKEADATITALKAGIEKTAAEHAAAVADFDKKVGERAAALLAQTGTTPVKLGSDTDIKGDLVAQMEAIKHPAEKIAFYRANKAAIDASFRRK